MIVVNVAIAKAPQAPKNIKNNWYNKLYVRADVGGFIPANKFKEKEGALYITKKPKKGAVYNIGAGYISNDNWRSDLNFNYRDLKYKAEEEDGGTNIMSQKIKIYSVFLSGYYDLNFHKVIKPYFVVGIGYSRIKSKPAIFTLDGDPLYTFPGKTTNNFAWNVGVGTRFIINNRFSLDASYTYVNLGKTKIQNAENDPDLLGASQKITSHDIMGGVIVHL